MSENFPRVLYICDIRKKLFNQFAVFDPADLFGKGIRRAFRHGNELAREVRLIRKTHLGGAVCPIYFGIFDQHNGGRAKPPRPRKLFRRESRNRLKPSFKLAHA